MEELEKLRCDNVWKYPDVAAFLKISEVAVRKKVERRQIPFRKDGRNVYFSELEIRNHYLSSNGSTY